MDDVPVCPQAKTEQLYPWSGMVKDIVNYHRSKLVDQSRLTSSPLSSGFVELHSAFHSCHVHISQSTVY